MVDKPAGITSHDVVDEVRRLTGIRKVGHAGTLDPFATGLLLVLVGKATRLSDLLMPLVKEYRVEAQFGAVSSTGDIDGELTPVPGRVERQDILAVLPRFTGTIDQRVPAYAAVKVNGEALYRKARRGEAVERPVRQVQIHDIRLESFDSERQRATMTVTCSRGTYIRQLCEDIGEQLSSGAYAAALRRTAIGELQAARALAPERLASIPGGSLLGDENPAFISCMGALYFLPVREVEQDELNAVTNGRPLAGEATGAIRVVGDRRLLAVYRPGREKGYIEPLVVLA